MSRPIDIVLDRLGQYRLRANGKDRWRACCPAHGGKNASALSVGIGADDAVLLRCWSGCEVDSIAQALGLELTDLFPPRLTGHGTPRPKRIGMLTASQALEVIEFEALLVSTAAFNLANGHALTEGDLSRLGVAAQRVAAIAREVRS